MLLTACGGGGGGGGGTDSGGGVVKPPSLVPAAPVLGDVLVADATELRPLTAGMRWHYDGTFTHAGSTGPGSRYSSTVTVADGPAGTLETQSGVFNDSTPLTIVVKAVPNGQVTRSEALTLLAGAPATNVTSIELRSPVRAGDQYVLFEQTGLPLQEDIDGDNVKDSADVAVYRIVRDRASVTTAVVGRVIDAIRVEDHYAYRINRSATKTTSPVFRAIETTWYASRIGVVRRSLSALGEGSAGPVEYDEVLRGFDGLTSGLGMLNAVALPVPAGQRAQDLLAHALVGDHVMTISGISEGSGEAGLRVAVIDKSGKAVAVNDYGDWKMPVNTRPSLAAIGQQAVLAWVEPMIDGSNGWPWRVRMVTLDRFGRPVGPVSGRLVVESALGMPGVTAAADGRHLWLIWPRKGSSFMTYELVAQAFDAVGNPVDTIQVLDTSGAFPMVRAAAGANDRVIAIWVATGTTYDRPVRHALLAAGQPPVVRELGLSSLISLPGGENRLLLGPQVGLWTWTGRYFTPTDHAAPASNGALRAAVLDPSSSWPAAGTGDLLDRLLVPATFGVEDEPPAVGLDGNMAYFAGAAYTQFSPGDYSKVFVTQLSAVRMDSVTRVSDAAAVTWRWQQSQEWGVTVCTSPKAVLPFSDRVLLLCEGSSLVVFK